MVCEPDRAGDFAGDRLMAEVLFLAHRIPYPPDKGDKIRSWNMLQRIAERATVHLGAFVDDPADLQHLPMLRKLCGGDVKLIPISKRQRWRRMLGGYFRGEALSLSVYRDSAMAGWTRDLMRRRKVGGIFCFSGQVAPYALQHLTGDRKTVMDFVDIDSEKFREYASEATGWRRRIYARESRLLLAFEKYVARQFGSSLFVSEAEAAAFRKLAGSWAHTVKVIGNGVDHAHFDPETVPAKLGPGPVVLFAGAMDYKPNIDAAVWFAATSWPLVRARYPSAAFVIAGSNPTAEVKKLGGKGGIIVTGRVPEMPPYLSAADVVVAPLRLARGIQNKVLEAMAMAKPVVATSAAFEGLHATPGTHLLIADDPTAIARDILALLSDRDRRMAMGHAARRHVIEHYDWNACLAPLDALLGLDAQAMV